MSTVDRVVAGFSRAGWTTSRQEPVGGGRAANPTRVDLARGKRRLKLLIYAWKITPEGNGRPGTDYRVQTTRSHDGDLMVEHGRLTLGFGVDEERQVIVAFDGWTKRATGSSSSVHIRRGTLDEAHSNGRSIQRPVWDGRAAARLDDVNQILDWIERQYEIRVVGFDPLTLDVIGDAATVTADVWASSPASWLRRGDRFFLTDRAFTRLRDTRIWTVQDLRVTVTNPGGRYPRRVVTLEARLHGRIYNPEQLLSDAAREAAV